jgi:hypothetical protein
MMTIALVFALGVLVGIMIGILLDDAFDMLKKEHFKMPFSTPANRIFSIGLLVSILLNLAVGLLLLRTRASAEDYYSCIADWQQEFAVGYTARANLTADVQVALDKIIMGVNRQDQTAFKEGVSEYVKLRASQDAERKKHPLPELPDQACGSAEEVRR